MAPTTITETRIDGPKVDEIIRRLPFVSMDILLATKQEIHAIVQVSYHAQPWLLSSIYGSPRFRERCLPWGNLKILSERHNLPWAVMGDFNDVVCDDEKMRGNGVCKRRVEEYTSCMNFCNLIDLGFIGPKGNLKWKSCFPEAFVKHLARINSDHCPLLLALDNPPIRIGERPFWFQPIWLSHTSFPPIVRDAWEGNQQNIRSAIITFTLKARNWNKEEFGNIFWKKRNLVARLGGVEKALAQNPSQRLINMHS